MHPCDEMGTSPRGILSKNPLPQSNHEKNITQTQFEGRSTKYLNSTPQNYQGHEKQETE